MGKIEWTDATWNPVGGCSIASPGCNRCYAQQLAGTRLRHLPLYAGTTTQQKGVPIFNGTMTAAADDHAVWSWPVRWRGAKAPRLGADQPSLIFVGDMADVFHANRPRGVIARVVASIIQSPHIGQFLTKRPDVMLECFKAWQADASWFFWPHPLFGKPNFAPEATFENVFPPRCWLGFSAERQPEFDARWPFMREFAAMGFTIYVSYEPALGPLDLPADFLALGRRAQVIFGGESGRRDPRPAHPAWARHVRDQCKAAGVSYFHKQNGVWRHAPDRAHFKEAIREPWQRVASQIDGVRPAFMVMEGKARAGRLLDGREHNEFPEPRQ